MEARATTEAAVSPLWKHAGVRISLGVLLAFDLLYWIFGSWAFTWGGEFFAWFFLAGFGLLWLFSALCVAIRYLVHRESDTSFEPQGRIVPAVVLLAVIVPLNALAVCLRVSWSNDARLADAKVHAERLVGEMEEFRAREGAYPMRLEELASGSALPEFAGYFDYGGGGPRELYLFEENLLGVSIWQFDQAQQAWIVDEIFD
jgi:hypothetical protein